jgi:uncharacterized protein (TIGR02217 family)
MVITGPFTPTHRRASRDRGLLLLVCTAILGVVSLLAMAVTVFDLYRAEAAGDDAPWQAILLAAGQTLVLAVAGSTLGGGDLSIDASTGRVELSAAPVAGAIVTAGFEFDVPVRFDTDRINASLAGFAAGEVPSIPVVEVRV